MKWLSKDLKRALGALAAADAGEMLGRRAKSRYLLDRQAAEHPRETAEPTPHGHKRRQVALWLNGAPVAALDYALATCQRLGMDLLLLHPQRTNPKAWLAGHAAALALSGVALETQVLASASEHSLRHFLAQHARIAFVVMGDGDAVLQGLAQKRHGARLPVPLVLVASPEPALPGAAGLRALAA